MPSFARSQSCPVLVSCLVALAVLAVPLAGLAQSIAPKIAVVNLEYVVANSIKGKALQAQLEKFQQEVGAELGKKQSAGRSIRQQIAEGVNSLSEERLTTLQQQYEDVTLDIKRYQDDKQREGQKMQAEGLRAIEMELEPVFKALRDEQGYDLILNNVPGSVVMASDRIDITLTVIERLSAAPRS